jgi:hypothetical protein
MLTDDRVRTAARASAPARMRAAVDSRNTRRTFSRYLSP